MEPASGAWVDSEVRGVKVVTNSDAFVRSLQGRRVLHVKGFGSGFKDATADQKALEAKQDQEAVNAICQFQPDHLVVDGDPWGAGFQRCIKLYADHRKRSSQGTTLPSLVWAKNVKMTAPLTHAGEPTDVAERDRRLAQAGEWATQCGIDVIVYWIDQDLITAKINALYGADISTRFEDEKFNARGLIVILSDPRPAWVDGMEEEMTKAIEAMEDPAKESPFFEKCSFENSAKGNVIFEVLDSPEIEVHGSVTFGGGESVLLELATKYLNSTSGFDKSKAAVFPHSRGKKGDPVLPRHLGSVFRTECSRSLASVQHEFERFCPAGSMHKDQFLIMLQTLDPRMIQKQMEEICTGKFVTDVQNVDWREFLKWLVD